MGFIRPVLPVAPFPGRPLPSCQWRVIRHPRGARVACHANHRFQAAFDLDRISRPFPAMELASHGPGAYAALSDIMQEIHGHEVMEFMIASGESFTRESLRDAIIERFGADARFHTCSADGMDAEGLIQFLEERGKFQAVEGGFTTDPSRMCNH